MTGRRVLPLVLVLVATPPDVASTASAARLEIVSGETIVWSGPIRPGEPFDVAFMHSQERVVWRQHYEAGAGATIWQRASTFPSYGAGMPSGSAVRTPRGYRVAVGQRFDAIRMLNSRAAQITLRLRDSTLPLSQWFADFERFAIRVR